METQAKNLAERQAGSIPGPVYIGVYLFIALVLGVALAGFGVVDLTGFLIVIGLGFIFGVFRMMQMRPHRSQYKESQDARE
mgnify:CR=1 FL=1|jgi:hypothetical protein